MSSALDPYAPLLAASLVLAILFLAQLLVADLAGIAEGHTPGTPVDPSHDDFHFRAVRAHANANETLAVYVLLAGLSIVTEASPMWSNALACAFVTGRLVHGGAYYADLRILRSIAFGVSLLCLFGLAGVTAVGLF